MTTHRPIFATGEIYHVFNRSIGKEPLFHLKPNLDRIIELVNYYRFEQQIRFSHFIQLPELLKRDYLRIEKTPLVDLYASSFMPNHYHFEIKQLQNNGISRFISNMQNSFAKFYNTKNDRNGGLFEDSFKAKIIKSTEEFIHINRYIHLNHVTSYLVTFEELKSYSWSSLSWYVHPKLNKFINTDPVMNHFKTLERFLNFLQDQIDYQRKLRLIKKLIN